jgi:hypothetical protein
MEIASRIRPSVTARRVLEEGSVTRVIDPSKTFGLVPSFC